MEKTQDFGLEFRVRVERERGVWTLEGNFLTAKMMYSKYKIK
jgi:hypothetical protein